MNDNEKDLYVRVVELEGGLIIEAIKTEKSRLFEVVYL